MFWDDITEEEEKALIHKTAEKILEYEMQAPAILFLETFKPLVSLGGQLGRFFLGPLTPFMSEREDALIQTFEKRENVEKLIQLLEEEKGKEKTEKTDSKKIKGWRRFFPI